MKKITTILLALGFMVSAQAQTQDSARVAQTATDSLAQRVQQLEQQVNTIQEDQKMTEIWKRKKYLAFTYGSQSLKDQDAGLKYKSKTAVGMQWDWFHIRFHKKPIAKMIMIGLDIALDVNFAKYKDLETIEGSDYANDEGTDFSDYEDEEDYETEGIDFLSNYDMMQIDGGIAIGPIVEIAPFSYTNGAAKDLKAFAYYHLIPSYSGIIIDEDVSGAFNLFNGIGVGLTWKWLSLGYEYRFGSAKYNRFSFEDEGYDEIDDLDDVIIDDLDDVISKDKVKFKTTTSRFFLRINF